jgi:hypothetical protein
VTPRQYDLLLTRSQKLAIWLPLVMFIVLPLIFVFVFVPTMVGNFPGATRPPSFFVAFPLAIFLIAAAFHARTIFLLPHRITVTRDRQLVFASRLRSTAIRAADVLSIEPGSLKLQAVGLSGYVLKHREGEIRFPGEFTGQYLLLYELKQANPALDLRGC